MSLRPAQELVHESSKFSLRQFFESQAAQAAIRSPAQLSNEGFAALNTKAETASSLALSPPATTAPPLPALFGRAPPPAPAPASAPAPLGASLTGATLPQPTDNKFTFSRLVPVTTPIQVQHQILQKHQQQAIKDVADTKPTGLQSSSSGEVMRLKAQVVTLNERLAHANANLSATSESVVRGNKALTTERAQFHSKYANLTKKLEETQAALAEAEALPKEDVVKNSKLLNAKVLELQVENEKLVATRAELTEALARAEEAAAPGAIDARISQTQEELAALQTKFTTLSAQHSVLLSDKLQLEKDIETKGEMLLAAESNVSAVNERVEELESTASGLREQLGASQVEVAQTDHLIDELDAKLAAARAEATGAPQGVEVEASRPALPVAEIKEYLRKQAFKNSRNPYYKEPNPEFVTKDGAGVHFRGHVIPHDAWNSMEREAQAWAEAQPIPEGDMGGNDPEAMKYLRRLAANRRNYQWDSMDEPPVFQDGSGVHFRGGVIPNDIWERMEREANELEEVEAPRPALPVGEIEAYLRKQAFKNSRNPYYKEPNPEIVTKDGAGVHFRGHVIPHDAWNSMEREAQAWAEAQPIPEGDMGGNDPEAMKYLRRLAANRRNYQWDSMDEPPVFQDGSGVHFRGRLIDNGDWKRMKREANELEEPTFGCCEDNCCPATARVEALERAALEAFNKTNGANEHECAQLHEEWTFLDSLAKRARHALTTGESERAVVAHVHTGLAAPVADAPPFDLASHISANPLVMGKTIDDNCLHCRATHTDAAAVEAPRDTSCAEARTNAFVQAVSKDLKFSMDGSQALYASSGSTGVALRV